MSAGIWTRKISKCPVTIIDDDGVLLVSVQQDGIIWEATYEEGVSLQTPGSLEAHATMPMQIEAIILVAVAKYRRRDKA